MQSIFGHLRVGVSRRGIERRDVEGVCAQTLRPGLCKGTANSHLGDRFLCHYATAEKPACIPFLRMPVYAAIEIANGESRRTIIPACDVDTRTRMFVSSFGW